MITKDQEITLRKVLGHYGVDQQETKCIEECAELIKAITDYKLQGPIASPKQSSELVGSMIEELADVIIMTKQLAMAVGQAEVESVIDYKVKRIAKRIGA